MHIVAEQDAGHWSAWLKREPWRAFGGPDPATAIRRLCEAVGLDAGSIAADHSRSRADHLEFVIGEPCPDCGGDGRYVGLHQAEDCRACAGVGRISRPC